MLKKQPIFLPPRGLFGSVSRSRQVSVVVPLILLTFLGVLFAPPELRAEVTVKEALSFFQSSDAQMEAVRKGEIVKVIASETEESGLPVGLIMLARRSPERIIEYVREAPIYKAIPMITAYGEIKGKGTLADFAGVKLEPNGVEEAGRYLKAAPGEELNLETKEIASFRALNAEGQKTAAQQKKVEALVRSTLLTRYRAYRAAGLSGIAPYDRGDGEAFHPGEELRTRLEKFEFLPEKSPSFYKVLLEYPAVRPSGLEEKFYWLNFEVFGRPTFALSHRAIYNDGSAYLFSERHFYASHDYNSLQAVAFLLPTKEGTLVLALYRVSTEQVAGFGSSVKKPVARALMQSPLEQVFEKMREDVEKK